MLYLNDQKVHYELKTTTGELAWTYAARKLHVGEIHMRSKVSAKSIA
jgi:hypothetical protein